MFCPVRMGDSAESKVTQQLMGAETSCLEIVVPFWEFHHHHYSIWYSFFAYISYSSQLTVKLGAYYPLNRTCSTMAKIRLSLIYTPDVKSFWNFAQSLTVILPCPAQKFKANVRLKWVSWTRFGSNMAFGGVSYFTAAPGNADISPYNMPDYPRWKSCSITNHCVGAINSNRLFTLRCCVHHGGITDMLCV